MLQQPSRLAFVLHACGIKAENNKSALQQIWSDLSAMIRLVNAWRRKQYTRIRPRQLAIILGGLLYLLSPADVIPDWILAMGLVDDLAVLSWTIAVLRQEIDRFLLWEKEVDQNPSPPDKQDKEQKRGIF